MYSGSKELTKNVKPTCFWGNPNFPVALNTKLLALERKISCEAVESNNNAMHTARLNFIQSESGDKFRSTRTSEDIHYFTGDIYQKK